MKIEVKLVRNSAKLPVKMTEHAAGYDLYSANSETVIIEPSKVKLIPTGLAISLPIGFEAQIRPRSGLALKNQIGLLNSPGTIDADYRGEIQIIMFNFGDEPFKVEPNMRIAQMVVAKHESIEFLEVENLNETDRGGGGFGHTNLK